jgi:hypothetical protein
MLRCALVVLWFSDVRHGHVSLPTLDWYRRKRLPSFADILHTLRRETFRTWVSAQLAEQHLRRNVLQLVFSVARMASSLRKSNLGRWRVVADDFCDEP